MSQPLYRFGDIFPINNNHSIVVQLPSHKKSFTIRSNEPNGPSIKLNLTHHSNSIVLPSQNDCFSIYTTVKFQFNEYMQRFESIETNVDLYFDSIEYWIRWPTFIEELCHKFAFTARMDMIVLWSCVKDRRLEYFQSSIWPIHDDFFDYTKHATRDTPLSYNGEWISIESQLVIHKIIIAMPGSAKKKTTLNQCFFFLLLSNVSSHI